MRLGRSRRLACRSHERNRRALVLLADTEERADAVLASRASEAIVPIANAADRLRAMKWSERRQRTRGGVVRGATSQAANDRVPKRDVGVDSFDPILPAPFV